MFWKCTSGTTAQGSCTTAKHRGVTETHQEPARNWCGSTAGAVLPAQPSGTTANYRWVTVTPMVVRVAHQRKYRISGTTVGASGTTAKYQRATETLMVVGGGTTTEVPHKRYYRRYQRYCRLLDSSRARTEQRDWSKVGEGIVGAYRLCMCWIDPYLPMRTPSKYEPAKTPTPKMQRLSIWTPFSMNLSLTRRRTQTLKPHIEKNQIRTNKEDAKDAMVWALYQWYDQATHSRAPLDSITINPITRSSKLTPWDR